MQKKLYMRIDFYSNLVKLRSRFRDKFLKIKYKSLSKKKILKHLDNLTPFNLKGNNKEYINYVIFANQRTGSTLLTKTLAEHSQVMGFGELFNKAIVNFNDKGHNVLNGRERNKILRDLFPNQFYEKIIKIGYKEKIKAVGFKAFLEHFNNGEKSKILQSLIQDSNLHVIHLHRINYLDMFFSLKRAQTLNKWHYKKNEEVKEVNLALNPSEFISFAKKYESDTHEIKKIFSNHPFLELSYEQMSINFDNELLKIQKFLGLKIENLMKRDSKKIETRSLKEKISNYDEFAHEINISKYKKFLSI